MSGLIRQVVLLLYFLVLPIFLSAGLMWLVYAFGRLLYDYHGMQEGLLCLGVFLSGVVMRQVIQRRAFHMGTLFTAGLALIGFAAITWLDMVTLKLYSPFLPRNLSYGVEPLVFALPLIGFGGMLASQWIWPFDNG